MPTDISLAVTAATVVYAMKTRIREMQVKRECDAQDVISIIVQHILWYERETAGQTLSSEASPIARLFPEWLETLKTEIATAERAPKSPWYIYDYIIVQAFEDLELQILKQKLELVK